MHACTHARMHAYMHTRIHACTHAHMHACTHTCAHTYTQAHTLTRIHASIHPCNYTGDLVSHPRPSYPSLPLPFQPHHPTATPGCTPLLLPSLHHFLFPHQLLPAPRPQLLPPPLSPPAYFLLYQPSPLPLALLDQSLCAQPQCQKAPAMNCSLHPCLRPRRRAELCVRAFQAKLSRVQSREVASWRSLRRARGRWTTSRAGRLGALRF